MPTYMISDLHLCAERPQSIKAFTEFMQFAAGGSDAVYILGDLFEAWVGDDDDGDVGNTVIDTLAAYSNSGRPLYFTRGNRDFLVGEGFAARTGCTLLSDYHAIDLYGRSTLLMHGDLLCTDDKPYLAMRQQFHDERWQQAFLLKPLAERWALARQLRAESQTATREKAEYIMDANADTVAKTFCNYGVVDIIHGHTHRPAIHDLMIDGKALRRIVLGDWYEQDSVLRCDEDGLELTRVSALMA